MTKNKSTRSKTARKTSKKKVENSVNVAAKNKQSSKELLESPWKIRVKWLGRWVAIPLVIYLVIFFLLQPHYIANFSNGFFLDSGDGFQNVWNIWWVNHSLGESGSNPYFTNMLHWPHGVSLLPQTMNIYNGLVAIPLMNIFGFSLVQAVNFAVVSAFIMGGLFMFWFIHKLIKSYWVAILGGALFTFSTYHFAHAIGHLQLVTMQFIPLFLLAFWVFIEKMRYRYAPLAAGALFLVMLSDYYYLFWCIMLGALYVAWRVYKGEFKLTRQNIKVFGLFAVCAGVLVLPLVVPLLLLSKTDPLVGSHDATQFGLDPATPFLPGGSWYWGSLTKGYWEHLEYMAEMNIFFGYALLAVLAVAFYKMIIKGRGSRTPVWLYFWWIVILLFGIMSLGPRASIYGKTAHFLPLPYAFAERLFPTLKLSGMPVRWILIVLIAAIVIVCYMLTKINIKTRKGLAIILLFVAVSFIDLWPARLPLTRPEEHSQKYVYALKELPYGSVIDNGAVSGAEQLFHQTIHTKPIAFGYVTRSQQSVEEKDFLIFAALEEGRHQDLCREFKVRYITTPAFRPLTTEFPIIYDDGEALIYDMKNSDNC